MVITITNRQRTLKPSVRHMEELANGAVGQCLEHPGLGAKPLPGFDTVEISLVSDRTISKLHVRFMNVPGATDVITFDHGEIVISAETAKRQAAEYAQDFHQELFRYIVHGLLHLNGHEDATEKDAASMWKVQEDIVRAHWRPVPANHDEPRISQGPRKSRSR